MIEKRIDIMVDIETLGLDRRKSFIVEVAMVPFFLPGIQHPDTLKSVEPWELEAIKLKISTHLQYGRGADASTIKWHEEQDHDVEALLNDGIDPHEAVKEIVQYVQRFEQMYDEVYYWCCGTDFDFPFLRAFCRDYNMHPISDDEAKKVFPYYRCLDLRTVNSIISALARMYNSKSSSWKELLKKNNKHNAYDDCIEQIRVLNVCKLYTQCWDSEIWDDESFLLEQCEEE